MADADEFVVSSEHLLRGTVRDWVDGVLTPLNLTGCTVKVRHRLNKGTAADWTCTPDPNQTLYPGRFSYQLTTTDLPSAGVVELQTFVTDAAAKVHKGDIVSLEVRSALP